MQQMGMKINHIHAGRANMFLSPVFREALATASGATIELYDTRQCKLYQEAYCRWKDLLQRTTVVTNAWSAPDHGLVMR